MGLAALWHVGPSQIRDQTHVSCIGRQILLYYILIYLDVGIDLFSHSYLILLFHCMRNECWFYLWQLGNHLMALGLTHCYIIPCSKGPRQFAFFLPSCVFLCWIAVLCPATFSPQRKDARTMMLLPFDENFIIFKHSV